MANSDRDRDNILAALLEGNHRPSNLGLGPFGLRPNSGIMPFLAPADQFLASAYSATIAPATIPALPAPPPAVRRKVFFSFHFEEDILRASIIRNSWRLRPGRKPSTSNFYDKSLWESSKREGADSLKQLIRKGMAGSSVTCVLAGTHTWERPWVRFEIAHSLWIGNGLFGACVHNVNDANVGPSKPGLNPFDHMSLDLRSDDRGDVYENIGGRWVKFDLMRWPVRWPRWLAKPRSGYLQPLSVGAPMYDYALDDGYNNLCHWAQRAANAAGRKC